MLNNFFFNGIQAQSSFDLVMDSTLVDSDSVFLVTQMPSYRNFSFYSNGNAYFQEWVSTTWWNKLKFYLTELFSAFLNKIYVIHPSLEFTEMVCVQFLLVIIFVYLLAMTDIFYLFNVRLGRC